MQARKAINLVRKAQKGQVSARRKVPELSVITEVLKTPTVHVLRQQKADGSTKLIAEVKDSKTSDAIIEAIEKAVTECQR